MRSVLNIETRTQKIQQTPAFNHLNLTLYLLQIFFWNKTLQIELSPLHVPRCQFCAQTSHQEPKFGVHYANRCLWMFITWLCIHKPYIWFMQILEFFMTESSWTFFPLCADDQFNPHNRLGDLAILQMRRLRHRGDKTAVLTCPKAKHVSKRWLGISTSEHIRKRNKHLGDTRDLL